MLPVDLDNVLSLESFADLVARRSGCVLEEMLPDESMLPVEGPEGRYVHEVLIPVLRTREQQEAPSPPASTWRVRQRFEPV